MSINKIHTDRVLKGLREDLEAMIASHLNNPYNGREIEYSVKQTLMQILDKNNERDFEHISLKAQLDENTSTAQITPLNLFTHLLLNGGIYVPPQILEGRQEFATEYGIFGIKETGPYFIPHDKIFFTLDDGDNN